MVRGRRRVGVIACMAALVAAGCGDDTTNSSDGDGGSSGSGSEAVSATLAIITTDIDTDTGDGFTDATEGEELVVGDRARTDTTGFAELTYHDGSWMRIESEATLTIDDLADTDDGQTVATSIDTGEAWNRVAELTEPDDDYTLDTPVATAAVRGTAFAVDCDGDTACTFSVIDGEVLITPDLGDPVTLTAGQTLTITADQQPPPPDEPGIDALTEQPFIAKNLELDDARADNDGTDDDDTGTNDNDADDDTGEETGSGDGSIAGSYVGLQTFRTVEYAPDAIVTSDHPGVGDDSPMEFKLTGPCEDGDSCELVLTSPGAPTDPLPLDLSGGRASGSTVVTRTTPVPPCSWQEEWMVDFTVDGDRLTGTASVGPESLDPGCARPVRTTSQFVVNRR